MSEQANMSAELKGAGKDVQAAFAKKVRRQALKQVREALERCEDVADVLPYRGGLQVAMMNCAILRVEIVQ
jgi:hypothetical protein